MTDEQVFSPRPAIAMLSACIARPIVILSVSEGSRIGAESERLFAFGSE
jgi:hypothetical protein